MSTTCRVRVTGPLAMYADGFRADLAARGYVAGSAGRNLRTLVHVSRWMGARLGLRAGEVAGLELDDLDWRAGEILVHGKGSRRERLPLRMSGRPWSPTCTAVPAPDAAGCSCG